MREGLAVWVSRGKLLYIRWINNKVLLYHTGNYIQYPATNHNGKAQERIHTHTHTHTHTRETALRPGTLCCLATMLAPEQTSPRATRYKETIGD